MAPWPACPIRTTQPRSLPCASYTGTPWKKTGQRAARMRRLTRRCMARLSCCLQAACTLTVVASSPQSHAGSRRRPPVLSWESQKQINPVTLLCVPGRCSAPKWKAERRTWSQPFCSFAVPRRPLSTLLVPESLDIAGQCAHLVPKAAVQHSPRETITEKQQVYVYESEMCGVLLRVCGTLLSCQVPEEPTYFQRSAKLKCARSRHGPYAASKHQAKPLCQAVTAVDNCSAALPSACRNQNSNSCC